MFGIGIYIILAAFVISAGIVLAGQHIGSAIAEGIVKAARERS